MKNERFTTPDFFSAVVPSGTKSGAPVLVLGGVPAVCATDEGAGGNIALRASVETRGVFDLWTTDAVSAEGTAIYITSGNALTTTSSSNTFFGRTIADAEGNGATKASGGTVTAGPFVHIRLAKV